MSNKTTKRPVTVVTGFLGSGKTTLLRRVLVAPPMRNTAVLVNEFGAIGLDHHLLRRVDEQTILLGGGCVCCARRADLVQALLELLGMDERGAIARLERVIIGTSGLAEPAPILFTILTDPVLQHHFFVDRVIATVDAVNGQEHLDRHPESRRQIAAADCMVVTKTDIAAPDVVERLVGRLRDLNPIGIVIQAAFGEVDVAALFGSGMGEADPWARYERGLALHGSEHTGETYSLSLAFESPLDWRAFGLWLSMLLHVHGEAILRVKGLLDVGEEGPVVLNGVQHIVHPPEHLDRWPDKDQRSRIVFITRALAPERLVASLCAFHQLLGAQPVMAEADGRGGAMRQVWAMDSGGKGDPVWPRLLTGVPIIGYTGLRCT